MTEVPQTANHDEALVEFRRLLAKRVEWFSEEDIEAPLSVENAVDAVSGERRRKRCDELVETIRLLLELLGDPETDSENRRRLAHIIQAVSPHVSTRSLWSEMARHLWYPESRPFLLDAMEHQRGGDIETLARSSDPRDRMGALVYLSADKRRVGDYPELLFEALDGPKEAQELAARCLWSIDARSLDPREQPLFDHLDELLSALDHPSGIVRAAAVTCASTHVWETVDGRYCVPHERAPKIVEKVIEALDDPDIRVRRRAFAVVRESDLDSSRLWDSLDDELLAQFVTALETGLSDEDEFIVERATDATYTMGHKSIL
ncbi:hypothetical protein [Haloferax sp. DFSO60]|uniref:hypothetical protein n=1 Tax=Haloferax sp. DFSO60 TaxID=3388652 RepID=UPI003979ED77